MSGEIIVRYSSIDEAIERLRVLEQRARSHASTTKQLDTSTGSVADQLALIHKQLSLFAAALADAIASSADKLSIAEIKMREADDTSAEMLTSTGEEVSFTGGLNGR